MVFLSQSDQNKQITALNLDTGSLIACLVGESKGVLVLLLNVNRDFTLPIQARTEQQRPWQKQYASFMQLFLMEHLNQRPQTEEKSLHAML